MGIGRRIINRRGDVESFLHGAYSFLSDPKMAVYVDILVYHKRAGLSTGEQTTKKQSETAPLALRIRLQVVGAAHTRKLFFRKKV
jgi:hypothetical protein